VGVIASFPPVRECKRDEVVLTKGDERRKGGIGILSSEKKPTEIVDTLSPLQLVLILPACSPLWAMRLVCTATVYGTVAK
jgi:hypothetical protein